LAGLLSSSRTISSTFTEQAALGVDLIECNGEATHNRLAGLGGLAGHGSDQSKLQRILGFGGDRRGKRNRAGEEKGAEQYRHAQFKEHGGTSWSGVN
jgi:hypothetical protein